MVRTMQTAGRAVVFSGIAVALGLALLVAMPLPFIRMLGVAGFLIPIVSIAAAVTLQPVLLSFYGRRGTVRHRVLPTREAAPGARLLGASRPDDHGEADRVPRRRDRVARRDGRARVLDPAHARARPSGSRAPRSRCRASTSFAVAVGSGAVAPSQILVQGPAGAVNAPPTQAAVKRLVAALERDPEVAKVYTGTGGPFVDSSRTFREVLVAGRHDYGFPQSQAFVKRLRSTIIPVGRLPGLDPRARRRRARPRVSTSFTSPTPTSSR